MKTDRRRWRLAATLLLAAGALALGWVGFPVPGLGRSLADEARHQLGIELVEGQLWFRLGEGLVLEDAEAVAETEGRRYRAELPRVRFGHRPRALLTGVIALDRIVFEDPSLQLMETDTPAEDGTTPQAASTTPASGWLRFEIDEVILTNATLSLQQGSAPAQTRITATDVRLDDIHLTEAGRRRGSLLAVEGSGELDAARGRFGDVDLTDIRSEIYLHEGKVSLSLLNFESEFAPFVAEMRVELEKSPFGYTVSSRGEPFDVAPFLAADPGAFQEASLLLEMFGRGPTRDGFRAQGGVTLPAGELPRVPILQAVNETAGRELFRPGDHFEDTVAVVRVRDGYVLFQTFDLVAERATATIRGRAYLDGKLELEVDVLDTAGGEPASAISVTVTGTTGQPILQKIAR